MQGVVGVVVGAVITLIIFSYLLGDNVLYRWALALLVGSAVGYALGVAIDYVQKWIADGMQQPDPVVSVAYAVPLLLGLLLLFKGFAPARFLGRISVVSNLSLGYLVGAGAAVAVAGAVLGTLIPQVRATGTIASVGPGLVQGLITALGTVVTLLYFTHRSRPVSGNVEPLPWYVRGLHMVGEVFLVFSLGTVFASAITSGLTALVMRISLVAELLRPLIGQ